MKSAGPCRMPRKIECMDDAMAEVIRKKSGAERLRIASDMYKSARQMLIAYLRSEHADWTEEQIIREAARRLSHGATSVCDTWWDHRSHRRANTPETTPMTSTMMASKKSEPVFTPPR